MKKLVLTTLFLLFTTPLSSMADFFIGSDKFVVENMYEFSKDTKPYQVLRQHIDLDYSNYTLTNIGLMDYVIRKYPEIYGVVELPKEYKLYKFIHYYSSGDIPKTIKCNPYCFVYSDIRGGRPPKGWPDITVIPEFLIAYNLCSGTEPTGLKHSLKPKDIRYKVKDLTTINVVKTLGYVISDNRPIAYNIQTAECRWLMSYYNNPRAYKHYWRAFEKEFIDGVEKLALKKNEVLFKEWNLNKVD